MALNPIKLGDFIASIFKTVNDNFSDLESRKADATDIPTKVSQLENDSSYATTDYVDNKVSTIFDYKGTVATQADLPAKGGKVGDVYFVTEKSSEYAWQGEHWEELGSIVDLSGYVQKEAGKGLSSNDYTGAEKEKLEGLSNYTLPVAGAQLGGVKSGGNVTINADGTLTAPTPEQGASVTRTDFTAGDSRWSTLTDGIYTLTLPGEGKQALGVYRKKADGDYSLTAVSIDPSGNDLCIGSLDKFEGYLLTI